MLRLLPLLLLLAACDTGGVPLEAIPTDRTPGGPTPDVSTSCIVSPTRFADGGVGKDGIPALTNPTLVDATQAPYLADTSRVAGLLLDGTPVAVPHNILWHHEIANFNGAATPLAVTYCPLTGSTMAFDRGGTGGAEFGVSGLLYLNNLVMYDRSTDESLWPQMTRAGGCGPRAGQPLPMYPVLDLTWAGWQALHPDTRVLSAQTGHARDYTPAGYPYGSYELPHNPLLLQRIAIDPRRLPKERVLGLPDGTGGLAIPFAALDASGPRQALHQTVGGREVVVFWSRAHGTAAAFSPTTPTGQALHFGADAERLFDRETGSTWRVDGLATDGPLAGTQLEAVPEAFVAFWFAWAAFYPDTAVWE